ncbi:hypothetical protein ACLOJK_018993, partial [Asimina triloba]
TATHLAGEQPSVALPSSPSTVTIASSLGCGNRHTTSDPSLQSMPVDVATNVPLPPIFGHSIGQPAKPIRAG